MNAGLDAKEAAKRLAEQGPNAIPHAEGTPAWRLLASQFTSPLVLLLFGASAVSLAIGQIVDAIAIGVIVVLNGAIGFYQEYGAQNAVLALRELTAPRARVLRDGHPEVVPSTEVVVGDLLLLEAGDIVAADAKVAEAHALAADEASLNGESVPADKGTAPTAEGAPLGDRTDHVFQGTAITAGSGSAVVIGTGMQTEIGRIADLLDTAEETATPLQEQLAHVGRTLLWLCPGIVAVVSVAGLLGGQPWLSVLMLAVPLAVAAVPEGLPAVVTIALAVGVRRMADRHVLVRKLPAVETLGSATVICTDKTGTLTTGDMAVRELWGPDEAALLYAAAACSDADIDGDSAASGDPTEVALLRAAAEQGIERSTLEEDNPRREVHPFDAVRKRMSIRREDGRLYVKGAVDLVLPLCTSGGEGATAANEAMAERGLRVLAMAVGTGAEEKDLAFLGLAGIADPPRPEAMEAIAQARRAGVTTVMITGDHRVTAVAIARELGIVQPDEDPDELVHARVTPEDKLRIVRSWKERGAIVAMTGDGVNDAPALREAHIGIAMGRGGTEVTREAADMVLTDDNFASIVDAIREGRGIWENIRKTVVYLLAGNLGELATVLGAVLLGLPLPLLPLHLLWVNLVTDGLPALALVMDPPAADVLERTPRPAGAAMLGKAQWFTIAWVGLLQAGVVLGVFAWRIEAHGVDDARTVAFTTIVFVELFRAFSARDPDRTFFEVGSFTNWRLLVVIALSTAVQFVLPELGVTRGLFGLTPLGWSELGLAMGLGLVPVTVIELSKLLRRAVASARQRRAP